MSESNALSGSVEPVVPVENVTPAPVEVTQGETPAETPAAETPAASPPSDVTQEQRKSRAQERIEELARENRRLRDEQKFRDELLQSVAQQQQPKPAPAAKPTLADFGYDQDKWADAVSDWAAARAQEQAVAKATEMFTAQQRQQAEEARRQAAMDSFRESENKFAATVDDYADTVYSNRARITDGMAEAITASPIGAQVAYHLVKSGKDREIANLPPSLQGRAIALIEAQLTAKPAPQVTRAAPPPQSITSTANVPSNLSPHERTDISDAEAVALIRKAKAERLRG